MTAILLVATITKIGGTAHPWAGAARHRTMGSPVRRILRTRAPFWDRCANAYFFNIAARRRPSRAPLRPRRLTSRISGCSLLNFRASEEKPRRNCWIAIRARPGDASARWASRGTVSGRGSHRPEEQLDPGMGANRQPAGGAKRSRLRLGLFVWCGSAVQSGKTRASAVNLPSPCRGSGVIGPLPEPTHLRIRMQRRITSPKFEARAPISSSSALTGRMSIGSDGCVRATLAQSGAHAVAATSN